MPRKKPRNPQEVLDIQKLRIEGQDITVREITGMIIAIDSLMGERGHLMIRNNIFFLIIISLGLGNVAIYQNITWLQYFSGTWLSIFILAAIVHNALGLEKYKLSSGEDNEDEKEKK
jgi:hypothetical protein